MRTDFSPFAYQLGQSAFDLGKGYRDNPYRKGTSGYKSWSRGFSSRSRKDKE